MLEIADLPPIVSHIEPVYCCCAQTTCAAVLHSTKVMQQLENDLRSAAKIGQHLIERHDRYVAEMQSERRTFEVELERQSDLARIVDELESNNRDLEDENMRTMRENAALLKRLEDLSASLSSADHHNEELRSTLMSTEDHVGLLSRKAAKAKSLEFEVTNLESQRQEIEQEMSALILNNKQSDVRYKQAEIQIAALHRQLEHIQSAEADHLDDSLPANIPEPRQISRVCQTSVDPLDLPGDSDLLSNLLNSNRSLEEGTADLLRVLQESQDEISSLREQLALHRAELRAPEDNVPRKTVSQELHQHHHYHYHVPSKQPEKKLKPRSSVALKRQSHLGIGVPLACSTPPPISQPVSHTSPRSCDPTPRRGSMGGIIRTKLSETPGSPRQHRDSGYFSLASMDGSEQSNMIEPSPCSKPSSGRAEISNDPERRPWRSNSHDSIYLSEPLLLFATPSDAPRANQKTKQRRCSVESIVHSGQETLDVGRFVRQAQSHESLIDQRIHSAQTQNLLQRSQMKRRPYASPLQNSASEATVSVTSATALGSKGHGTSSLDTLRNASNARSSLSIQTVPTIGAAKAIFWRKHSDKKIPTISRPSRWSFASWNSGGIPTAGQAATTTHLSEAHISTESVLVSNVDESLLTEALGF